ncbi:MAG: RNA polymerase sigma factor [Fermentimonas sp.]
MNSYLWNNFLDGDTSAFSSIYKEFFEKLYVYGLKLGFNEEVCKDAIQDVFYTIFTSRKKLNHVENIEFYLFRCLKNRLLDQYSKEVTTDILNHDELILDSNEIIIEQIIKNEAEMQMKNTVNLLFKKLTKKQRKVIHYKYVLNLTYNEIAIIMDVSPDAVKKMVRRALDAMRNDDKISREFIIFVLIITTIS